MPVKESYRISQILKKLTGLTFHGAQHLPEITEKAREKAEAYLSRHKPTEKPHRASHSGKKTNEERDRYIQYQRQVTAEKLIGSGNIPQPPGRILKLPVTRKPLEDSEE